MHWISVKSRYPREHKEAVAYAFDGKKVREDIFYSEKEGWCIDNKDYCEKFKGKITHWIPAIPYPKPPEDYV